MHEKIREYKIHTVNEMNIAKFDLKVEVEHSYSASCTRKCSMEMQRLSSEIKIMEEELNTLKLICEKRKPMTVAEIRYSEEKVNIVNELN